MVITNIIANIRKRNPNTNLMVIPTKTILTLLSLAMTQMTRTTVFEKKKREKKMKILKIEKKEPFPPNEINFKKNDNSVVPCPLEIWFFFFFVL